MILLRKLLVLLVGLVLQSSSHVEAVSMHNINVDASQLFVVPLHHTNFSMDNTGQAINNIRINYK